MLKDRIELYKELEKKRDSTLIVYTTSDRKGLETQIGNDIFSNFVNHLDKIYKTEKISLYLYTRGGNTLAAWGLINLIRNYCNEFEVIVPFHCHSAGTLICLGSNNIVMTKQATLGPIDPSINGPLNPQIPGAPPNARFPVSVESVNGYFEMAKDVLNLRKKDDLNQVLLKLSDTVHPLVLGQVRRATSQIQMLAKKIITHQKLKTDEEEKVIKFLCSESGSHDYPIYRFEARNILGLNIETPNDELYKLIKAIYDDIENELELTTPFDPKIMLAGQNHLDYTFRRALIETVNGGCDVFVSKGRLIKQIIPKPPLQEILIEDQRSFEGWRHERMTNN